ncbi:hypothetical protein [Peloplasma aerotolerans]|uniref:Uncharacterized protein n=1 Tax=Peloplasma aerotolerans TaxID=3044389 RepID=A0AAW6U2R1_9MOLU|nr:hypothetical protein [Mariniplasma sp. M4Ah]MDI6452256.1 hypothetical protein [Mariniplasma sp. M4Ah]MDR4968499.1 hypothetical protein [Acholeplasmataceae bacterium]
MGMLIIYIASGFAFFILMMNFIVWLFRAKSNALEEHGLREKHQNPWKVQKDEVYGDIEDVWEKFDRKIEKRERENRYKNRNK